MAYGVLFLASFLDSENSVAVDTVWYKQSRDVWARGGNGKIIRNRKKICDVGETVSHLPVAAVPH